MYVILVIKLQNLLYIYLSMGGLYKNISLCEDSCLCSACYLDCTRKTGKPRWYVYSKNSVLRHCVMLRSCYLQNVKKFWSGALKTGLMVKILSKGGSILQLMIIT